MKIRTKGQVGPRFIVYIFGLLLMSLGLVFLIKADLGATPWDVLHVGLYYQLGLTIGTWSILVGIVILASSAILSKEFPQIGAWLNMVLIGFFMDMYLLIPFLQTPDGWIGKLLMFTLGLVFNAYGMALYISARFGAGPRDSLMLALSAITKWKVRNVRAVMEILVLIVGWFLGGPVFFGTIVFSLAIGPLAGISIPQCQKLTDIVLSKLNKQVQKEINRGA